MPGRPIPTRASHTLFDLADAAALRVPTSCRRRGRCRECVVEVRSGEEQLTPRTDAESFLRPPFRLACQAVLTDPAATVDFDVVRRRLHIALPAPRAEAAPPDPQVRTVDGVVCWGDRPIEPARGDAFGVAVDLGTTTIVVELVNLATGRTVGVAALENPQRFGGSDVMNRISYDASKPGELRQAARRAINGELRELYARSGVSRRDVYEVVVVGNTTMRDIFFGVDVSTVGERPYKSITELELLEGRRRSTQLVLEAWELGLKVHPKARVWSPPLVAGHVGGDVAADFVAAEFGTRGGVEMLVDVGTNTEVVLTDGRRTLAASCPAGPAFEGGDVTFGMQAAEGAIDSLRFDDDAITWSTIGDGSPVGLCGSGLIDLVAELRRTGRMTPKGVFPARATTFEVLPDKGIFLSRADAAALAQAKAATTVGQWILLRTLGVEPGDVGRLYLAGGFASYVNVENAVSVGFLAPVPPDRVVKLGNAALEGARRLLLSASARGRLESFVRTIEHVELELTPDFFELFVDGCQFKPIPSRLTSDLVRAAG
jgi:uncharacterized 2Fe-2S/4Fe-4S cluster protein (DUF4445 family)